jgi:chloramphenicol 3-O-phosphotransferase
MWWLGMTKTADQRELEEERGGEREGGWARGREEKVCVCVREGEIAFSCLLLL